MSKTTSYSVTRHSTEHGDKTATIALVAKDGKDWVEITNPGAFAAREYLFLGASSKKGQAQEYRPLDREGLRVTTITTDYEQQWGPWEIMREFVSNALDAIGYRIGQFGEGSKIASLTACRLGIEVRLSSGDWTASPQLVEDEGMQVLAFDLRRVECMASQTTVMIEATPAILSILYDLPHYILHLRSSGGWRRLMTDRADVGRLYNRGIYISDLPGAVYGYDVDLQGINRDRNAISREEVTKGMAYIWHTDATVDEIVELLKKASKMQENTINPDLQAVATYYRHWRSQWKQAFGDKARLATDKDASKDAQRKGFKIVELPRILHDSLDVPKDVDEQPKNGDIEKSRNLTKQERRNLEFLGNLTSNLLYATPGKVEFFAFEQTAKTESTLGIWMPDEDVTGIRRDQLEVYSHPIQYRDVQEMVNTAIHEATHQKSKASDNTRDFEDAFCRTLTEAATRNATLTLNVTSYGIELPHVYDRVICWTPTVKLIACDTHYIFKTTDLMIKVNVFSQVPKEYIKEFEVKTVNAFDETTYYLPLNSHLKADLEKITTNGTIQATIERL